MLNHIPDSNPYAAPQAEVLPQATEVAAQPTRVDYSILTLTNGAWLCLKAVIFTMLASSALVAGLILQEQLLLALVLIMSLAALFCHFRGLLQFWKAAEDRLTRTLFTLSLITFCLVPFFVLMGFSPILLQQYPQVFIIDPFIRITCFGSLLWGLMRLAKSHGHEAAEGCAGLALIILVTLNIVMLFFIAFLMFNPPQQQAMPLQLDTPTLVVVILLAIATLVGSISYILALWYIRQFGTPKLRRSRMLVPPPGLRLKSKN